MSESLLRVENLCYAKDGRSVIDHVSFSLERGKTLTVIGPNGAGKTTLLRMIIGILEPDSGKIIKKKGLKIGYLPQKINLNPLIPLSVRRMLQLTHRYPEQLMRQMLRKTDVESLLEHRFDSLSGGETQRVMLARALLECPDILVLDEPASGVDIIGEAVMYELIASLSEETGASILMVSHDLHLVMSRSDEVLCLNRHVCCSGQPESVSRHPEYLQLFGDQASAVAVYTHHHDHVHDLDGGCSSCDEHEDEPQRESASAG